MIVFVKGDILEASVEALVNPVNCEGYMGKGLALQVKKLYPETFKNYSRVCKEGQLKIGNIHYFREKEIIIINFPTKDKWKAKSKLSYIIDGLPELINLIKELDIKSIAIPPIGCGLGGLKWDDVKQVLVENLRVVSNDVDIFIYQPI